MYKGEVNYVIGSQFFLAARVGYVGGGFSLTPQGGLDTQWYRDDGGSQRGSYSDYATVRPQHNVAGEGNYFRGRHEVKFGYGWRRADTDSTSTVPGNEIISYHDGYPNMIAEVTAWGHCDLHSGALHQRLHRRHDHGQSADDESRRALGSTGRIGEGAGTNGQQHSA